MSTATREGLPAWLREWRHSNRWTQERLAEALGYEVSYVAKIERGRRRPSEQFVARLADVAAIPKQELLRLCRRPTARVRLPVPGGPVVGRASEIAEVRKLLLARRCVTLVGAPGIGKTTLATEVAWHMADTYRDGACFVPLADVSESASVPTAVALKLGLAQLQRGGCDPDDVLVEAVRNRAMLLVLDNFEHVLAARSMVEKLVLHAPRVRVLLTSREAVGVTGEHTYAVRPLAFPDPSGELEDVESYPAVEVFVTRSRLVRPDFALTPTNVRPIVEICRRLDGLPLAITLTAAASKILSPSDIVRSLSARLELPADAATGRLVDRRLTAALDWSWSLLDSSQQRLFARLAVFADGYSLAAAETISATGVDGDDVLGIVAALESKSLVEAVPSKTGVSRFRSLETVRRYGEHRLRESGCLDELRKRHCAYYADLSEKAEPHLTGGGDQARWLAVLDEDYANLAAAFEWALLDEPTTALRMAATLWRFFFMRRISEGRRWLKATLQATPAPSILRVKALNGMAMLARHQGDLDLALDCLDESRGLALELGARSELAFAVLTQGNVADQKGAYDVAERCLEEATALYREIGDERGMGHGLNGLGVVALRRNDHQSATERFLEALNCFRGLNDRWSVAITATNLGWVAEMEDELGEARDWYEESRQIREGIGDEYACAKSLADLGRIARRQKDAARAGELLEQALHVFHRSGDRRLAAACLVELAAVAAQRRRRDMVARLLGAAEGVRHRLGTPGWQEEMALHHELVESLQAGSSDGAVGRALRIGRALSLEDAVDLVAGGTWPPAYRRWTTTPVRPAGVPTASSF